MMVTARGPQDGDHKQLPPVITSPEAQAQGLGVSLFERLSEENCEYTHGAMK